jgi:hypothetical protein
VGSLLGEEAAREVRVEPVEVRLPAARVLGSERAVVKDVGEDKQAALGAGLELEPEVFILGSTVFDRDIVSDLDLVEGGEASAVDA